MAHSDTGSSQRATGVSGSGLKKASLAAAMMAAFAPPASWALFEDRVEIWAAENVTHDSNVLRLSKDLNPLFPAPGPIFGVMHGEHVLGGPGF